MDTLFNDLAQWFGVMVAGGTALLAIGKREKRLEDAEQIAKAAQALGINTAQSVAALEAKLTLMLDMLSRIQRILDRTNVE